MCVCVCVYVCIYICIYMYIYIYIYKYICIYMYVYLYTDIYTYACLPRTDLDDQSAGEAVLGRAGRGAGARVHIQIC